MIVNLFFYLFSGVLLISLLMINFNQNSIYSVLFLVLSFLSLSLLLIFVIIYLSAIAVLFWQLWIKQSLWFTWLKYFSSRNVLGMVIISKIIFLIPNKFELNPYFLLCDLNIRMASLNPSMITSGDEVVLCEGWNHILNMENNDRFSIPPVQRPSLEPPLLKQTRSGQGLPITPMERIPTRLLLNLDAWLEERIQRVKLEMRRSPR